jgi:hypothetical protein
LSAAVSGAYQDRYATEVVVPVAAISSSLPELVHSILAPLYQLFDFFPLPKRLVEEELRELQRHSFSR